MQGHIKAYLWQLLNTLNSLSPKKAHHPVLVHSSLSNFTTSVNPSD